jgi:hypothetical protein
MSGEEKGTGWKAAGLDRDYTRGWKNYRRRRRWLCGVMVASFAILMISAALIHDKPVAEVVCGIFISIWFLASLVFLIWRGLFRCPRCGRYFYWTWLRHDSFAQRCIHCGLRKWAKDDTQSEDV